MVTDIHARPPCRFHELGQRKKCPCGERLTSRASAKPQRVGGCRTREARAEENSMPCDSGCGVRKERVWCHKDPEFDASRCPGLRLRDGKVSRK